jgi:hypothetical protein
MPRNMPQNIPPSSRVAGDDPPLTNRRALQYALAFTLSITVSAAAAGG